jgi:hypothetical protein
MRCPAQQPQQVLVWGEVRVRCKVYDATRAYGDIGTAECCRGDENRGV